MENGNDNVQMVPINSLAVVIGNAFLNSLKGLSEDEIKALVLNGSAAAVTVKRNTSPPKKEKAEDSGETRTCPRIKRGSDGVPCGRKITKAENDYCSNCTGVLNRSKNKDNGGEAKTATVKNPKKSAQGQSADRGKFVLGSKEKKEAPKNNSISGTPSKVYDGYLVVPKNDTLYLAKKNVKGKIEFHAKFEDGSNRDLAELDDNDIKLFTELKWAHIDISSFPEPKDDDAEEPSIDDFTVGDDEDGDGSGEEELEDPEEPEDEELEEPDALPESEDEQVEVEEEPLKQQKANGRGAAAKNNAKSAPVTNGKGAKVSDKPAGRQVKSKAALKKDDDEAV